MPEMPESISQTLCNMGTQTEWPSVTTLVSMVDDSTQCEMPTTIHSPTTCNAECQFPLDVCEAGLADHTYCDMKAPQVEVGEIVPDLDQLEEVKELDAYNASQGSQLDLFPDLNEVEPNEEENAVDEPREVIISQEMVSSQSEYEPSGDQTASQDEAPSYEQEIVESSFGKQRVFLIYEQKLKELLRFCPRCGALIVPESIEEVQNEGTQLTLKLNCMNNCSYKWQSQPALCDIKGAGNLLVSAGIFFCGIPFSKFQSFSRLINLKCIGQGTYYNLREKYVFPVVTTTWKEQQAEIFADLKSRETEAVLAGDGRCDSPGHCAKYCTYTLLDVESQKVVDFKVVVVSEVANSNCMEKKGFVDTLSNIEANGIKVGVISTDRHPQIKKEMKVNHPNIDHQFDPWHVAKSVSKKLSAASKKSGCSELAPWIPSIVNHLWWSAESCGKDPEVLKERWLSVIHHMTNRHEWPGNRYFHKCEHGRLTTEEQRRKKCLKPGSTAHTALLNIVKDKNLLKDIVHLVECVHTTALEMYHSLYLKYLPKLTHFTHDVLKAGTMLAALDHNFNSNRPQVSQIHDTLFMIPQYFNSKSKCQQANSAYLSPYICYKTSGKVVKQKYNFLLLIIFLFS